MDVSTLLEELKDSPYKTVKVTAPHTGVIETVVKETGEAVKAGQLLAYIERERNKKPVKAPLKGKIESISRDVEGAFVEEGAELFTIRHYLTKDEAIEVILKEALYLFRAPEQARYYFVPVADKKIKTSGPKSVRVRDGMDLFIMSRMKRERIVPYEGPEGLIYAVYFKHGENVPLNAPLIGVCPEDQMSRIQDVIGRVHGEWEEPE
jgi:predicted deacylase